MGREGFTGGDFNHLAGNLLWGSGMNRGACCAQWWPCAGLVDGLRRQSSSLNALSRKRGMVAMVLLIVCTVVTGNEHAVGPRLFCQLSTCSRIVTSR